MPFLLAATPPTAASSVGDAEAPGWTARGKVLALACASLALSSSEVFRPAVGGLLLHPYLLPLGIAAILVGLSGLRRFPRLTAVGFSVFFAAFVLVSLPAGIGMNEIAKVATALATICIVALAPISATDRDRSIAAYCIGLALLSAGALASQQDGGVVGIVPFADTGNKNSFSVYALPAMLLGGFLVLDRGAARGARVVTGLSVVVITIALFSTGNRSGFLGAALVVVMLLSRGRRLRDMAVIASLGIAAVLLLNTVGSTEAFWFRISRPATSVRSDEVREELFTTAVRLGLENPIFGVGPPQVSNRLGEELGEGGPIEPHNLYGLIWAGGGAILLLGFVALLAGLWMRPLSWRLVPPTQSQSSYLSLLRMMVLLFLLRSTFTAETLTAPGFVFGFGLALSGTLSANLTSWHRA